MNIISPMKLTASQNCQSNARPQYGFAMHASDYVAWNQRFLRSLSTDLVKDVGFAVPYADNLTRGFFTLIGLRSFQNWFRNSYMKYS